VNFDRRRARRGREFEPILPVFAFNERCGATEKPSPGDPGGGFFVPGSQTSARRRDELKESVFARGAGRRYHAVHRARRSRTSRIDFLNIARWARGAKPGGRTGRPIACASADLPSEAQSGRRGSYVIFL